MNEANAKFKRLFMKMLDEVELWQDQHQATMDLLSDLLSNRKHFSVISHSCPGGGGTSHGGSHGGSSSGTKNESLKNKKLVVGSIFAQFPHVTRLTQYSYMEQLERCQLEIYKYEKVQGQVVSRLFQLQNEAFQYFEHHRLDLNVWMDLQRTNLHKSTQKFAKLYEEYAVAMKGSGGSNEKGEKSEKKSENHVDQSLMEQHPFYIMASYLSEIQDIFLMFQRELDDKVKLVRTVDYMMMSVEELTRLYHLFSQYKFVNVDRAIEILEKAESESAK